MSISAAIAYRWDGERADLYFQMKPGSYDSESLIAFLKDLKRQMRGKKVILIWDGLPAHKSRIVTEYVRSQAKWLTVERLPGYAPDLNPVEGLWGNIKGQELANLCARDLREATRACRKGLARVRKSDQLCFSFLDNAGLFL